MSSGTENICVFGTDGKPVKLTKVYHLISSSKFPGMAGKPKMLVVETCSGGMQLFDQTIINRIPVVTFAGYIFWP